MNKNVHSKKLTFGILMLSLTWAIAFTWLFSSNLYNERSALIEKEKNVITNMSHITSVQTRDYFERIHMFLITADLWLSSHPDADPRTDVEFVALVNAFRESSNGKIDIRLVSDEGGLYYIPSESLVPLTDVSDRLYYTAQLDPKTRGFFISDPVKSRVSGVWGIPISYPLKSDNFGVSVIFSVIEIQNLEDLYLPLRSNVNETIILVKKDGTILSHTPFNDEVLGKEMINWFDWENIIKNTESGIILKKSDDTQKITSMAAYDTLNNLPLVVIVIADMHATLSHWNSTLIPRISLLFAVLTFVALTTYIMIRLVSKLENALDEISKLSITDSLTGLFNRRKAQELLDREIFKDERYNFNFSVILLDIDHFKNINDQYGHNFGDMILKSLAQIISENVRKSDSVCRWGGEEFVILCTNTTFEVAMIVAEKLRLLIDAHLFDKTCHITCSFGVATYLPEDSSDSLINKADEALYHSKAAGRNKVMAFEIGRAHV